ncbi:hypothetical protein GCM10007320_35140 [Pseudorhodoferax aquiterrae]|uniref:Uncharacterized protein n=1 Tax=Pseudorhodoferax aquiterrae TaxID=747304 RepID=A0ABQ3G3W5_9BURK|nr:hypothetical protein [Pseudorhodoferax aquiterrae]GHC88209.1 hypothetical protein GCM10007320_35140 [Pseudorhodoferax aquiterrae]
MRKSRDKNFQFSQAEKEQAIARALQENEDKYSVPRQRSTFNGLDGLQPQADAKRKEALESGRRYLESWLRDPPWFTFYSPYRSVLQGDAPKFVDRKGGALTLRNPSSSRQLLYLAKEAADEYLGGNKITEQEWQKALGDWKRIVDDMRRDIAAGKFEFQDPLGGSVSPDLEHLDPFEVLSIGYQLLGSKCQPNKEEESRKDYEVGIKIFHKLWCVICLSEIDSAVLSLMYEDAGDGLDSAIRATQALGYARECEHLASALIHLGLSEASEREALVVPLRKEFALAGAKAKLAKDPKQEAKREVKEWWLSWRANPALYPGKSSFARAMLDKYPDLSSQPVIEGWSRSWEKEES